MESQKRGTFNDWWQRLVSFLKEPSGWYMNMQGTAPALLVFDLNTLDVKLYFIWLKGCLGRMWQTANVEVWLWKQHFFGRALQLARFNCHDSTLNWLTSKSIVGKGREEETKIWLSWRSNTIFSLQFHEFSEANAAWPYFLISVKSKGNIFPLYACTKSCIKNSESNVL